MVEVWPKEEIPDADLLFMRVHVLNVAPTGEPTPEAFRDHGSGMSTNWQKYCETAEQARLKARAPEKNGVVQLVAGTVRSIPPLSVEHTPDMVRMDRSHADVLGQKSAEVRLKLSRACRWAIQVTPS